MTIKQETLQMLGSTKKDYSQMSTNEILAEAMRELDEIKRYVANVYNSTDTEVGEIKEMCKKIGIQLRETDNQIDRIERFERTLNDIKSSLKQIERKL